MTPEERDTLLTAKNEKAKAHARELRVKSAADAHALLLSRLSEPCFRALYIAVARLFANELVGQEALMRKAEALPGGEERNRIAREVSLVGKWAPTPGASHDRVTNISTAIAILLHHGGAMSSLSRPIVTSNAVSTEDANVLPRSINAGCSHLYALLLVCPNCLWPRADGAISRTNMSPLSVCTSTASTSSSMTRSDSRPTWTAWQRARRGFRGDISPARAACQGPRAAQLRIQGRQTIKAIASICASRAHRKARGASHRCPI